MTWPWSRAAARCASGAACLAIGAPIASVFVAPGIPWWVKGGTAAGFAVSALRPAGGLGFLVLVLPFSAVFERLLAGSISNTTVSDILLLAFVSGASLRLACPPPAPSSPRLFAPAMVLLAAVVTSTVVELHALHVVAPRRPLLADIWRHLTVDYVANTREFAVVHAAWRWSAWLALAVFAERLVLRASPSLRLVHVWLAGGVIGAAIATTRVVEIVVRSKSAALETTWGLLRDVRLTVLHPDVNAAGSYFALFLVATVAMAWRRRQYAFLAAGGFLLVLASAVARSRAAIASVVIVGIGAACARFVRHRIAAPASAGARGRRLIAVVLVAVAIVGVTLAATRRSHVDPMTAVQVRVEMTEVGLRAAARAPVFGVGLGDYPRMTRRHMNADTPLLLASAPAGENAHNNFLQILVELGAPALVAFLWLIGPVGVAGFTTHAAPPPELQAMSLGIAAFLVSALFGHPLLISQVGTMFFAALGVAAAMMPVAPPSAIRRGIAHAGVACYLVALVFRLL